jgi:O-antigen/teichoic acid export membrane protein
VPSFLHIHGPQATVLSGTFMLAGIAGSLMFFFNAGFSILTGLQKQIHGAMAGIAGLVTGTLVSLFFLFQGYGLYAIGIGVLADALVRSATTLVLLRATLRRHSGLRIRFSFPVLREILRSSVVLSAGSMVYAVVARTPNIFLGHVFGPSTCTIYTFTSLVQVMLITVAAQISQAVLPGLAYRLGAEEPSSVKPLVSRMLKLGIMMSGLLMGGILVLNEEFVRLWVGPSFYGGTLLNALFCVTGLFAVLYLSLQNLVVAAGNFHTAARGNLLKSGLHFIALLGLGYAISLEGVAISALIGFIVATALIQIPFVKIWFKFDSSIKVCDVVSVVMWLLIPLAVGFVMKTFWDPHGWVELIIFGGIYTALVGVGYMLYDRDFRGIVREAVKT